MAKDGDLVALRTEVDALCPPLPLHQPQELLGFCWDLIPTPDFSLQCLPVSEVPPPPPHPWPSPTGLLLSFPAPLTVSLRTEVWAKGRALSEVAVGV